MTLKESIVLINHTDCMPFFGYAVILKKIIYKSSRSLPNVLESKNK